MKKKTIAIVYPAPFVGGSTTSLLGFLESINKQDFSITLFFFSTKGALLNAFKAVPGIEIINLNTEERVARSKRLCPLAWITKCFALLLRFITKKKNANGQIMSYCNNWFRPKIKRPKFDIAISFLESDTSIFVAKKITAAKKIAWVHVDYLKAGFLPLFDRKLYRVFDSIVTVSQECKNAFETAFPSERKRVLYIPNILSSEYVKTMQAEGKSDNLIEPFIVTTCRIDLNHKGLDRAFAALSDIKKKQTIAFKWYIIGDGPDFMTAKKLVDDLHLGDVVFFLGQKTNPFPYYEKASLFFLPSRYEGRPMAVDEALLAGLPCVITNYASAQEQIAPGINGLIIDNSFDGIHSFLQKLNSFEIDFEEMKHRALNYTYSNSEALNKIGSFLNA